MEKEKEGERSHGLSVLWGGGLITYIQAVEQGQFSFHRRPAYIDWTPPAKRTAADCFIKLQRLGVRGREWQRQRESILLPRAALLKLRFKSSFQTHHFKLRLQILITLGVQGYWQETCRHQNSKTDEKDSGFHDKNDAQLCPSLRPYPRWERQQLSDIALQPGVPLCCCSTDQRPVDREGWKRDT